MSCRVGCKSSTGRKRTAQLRAVRSYAFIHVNVYRPTVALDDAPALGHHPPARYMYWVKYTPSRGGEISSSLEKPVNPMRAANVCEVEDELAVERCSYTSGHFTAILDHSREETPVWHMQIFASRPKDQSSCQMD